MMEFTRQIAPGLNVVCNGLGFAFCGDIRRIRSIMTQPFQELKKDTGPAQSASRESGLCRRDLLLLYELSLWLFVVEHLQI